MLCSAVLLAASQAGAQGVDGLEIDVPRPPGTNATPAATNAPGPVRGLTLDSAHRELRLAAGGAALSMGALPRPDLEDQSEYGRLKVAAARHVLAGRHVEADRALLRLSHARGDDPDVLGLWAHATFCLGDLERCAAQLEALREIEPEHVTGGFLKLCLDVARDQEPEAADRPWVRRPLIEVEAFVYWLKRHRAQLSRTLSDAQFDRVCELALGGGTAAKLGPILESLRAARKAHEQEDWEKSMLYADLARSHGLRSAQLYMRLVESQFRLGRLDEAKQALSALVREFPKHEHIWYNHGLVLTERGEYAEAVPAFRRALEIAPGNHSFRFGLACALAGLGEAAAAREELDRLREAVPKELAAWLRGDRAYLERLRACDADR